MESSSSAHVTSSLQPHFETEIDVKLFRSLPRFPERVKHVGGYVTLEPLAPIHIAQLWPFAAQAPERWRWLPFGPFPNFATFEVYTRLMMSSREEIVWCACPHGETGEAGPAAGWIALLDIQNKNATIELGNVWFSSLLARTSAATEAITLLLAHAFDDLGYGRVAWKCSAQHDASRRCAERIGFSYEGTLRAHMLVHGARRDTAYYSLLAEEWPERRAALNTWLTPGNFDERGCQINRLRRSA